MKTLVVIIVSVVLASAQMVSAWAIDEGNESSNHHHFGHAGDHVGHADDVSAINGVDDVSKGLQVPTDDPQHCADMLFHTLYHATASTSECAPSFPALARLYGGGEFDQPHDRLLLPPVPPPNIQTI